MCYFTGNHGVKINKFKRMLNDEIGTNFFDPTFRSRVSVFLIQAVLATITICLVLFFIDLFYNAIVGAALGATCLGLFISPSGRISRIRSVVGGHSLAILFGSLISIFFYSSVGESIRDSIPHIHVVFLGITCGVLFLAMAISDTEHPPAAGMLLGLCEREIDSTIIISLVVALAALAMIKLVLRSKLVDLI